MKNIIAIIVLLLLNATAIAAQWPDFPFLYSVGKATREIPPDLAKSTFHVEVFDENPEKALDLAQKRGIELISIFKDLKIPKEDIETYEINKTAVRQEKDYVELKILGYEISQRFLVTLTGLTQYTQLIEKLLKLKNVVNIATDFDISNRKEIEASLTTEACADARMYAEHMANGVGSKLGSVFAISDRGFHELEDLFGLSSNINDKLDRAFRKGVAEGTETIVFEPSTIKVEKMVNVIFKLEAK